MLNSKSFNFKFFLGGREEVENLKIGAIRNGGATKLKNKIISNIPTDDLIRVSENNTISIFVPSTINVNEEVDNSQYVLNVINTLTERYDIKNLTFYNTKGSWYDDESLEVIIEKITLVSLDLKCITEIDIKYFINIAEYLKREMNQQAVSISINESLAII